MHCVVSSRALREREHGVPRLPHCGEREQLSMRSRLYGVREHAVLTVVSVSMRVVMSVCCVYVCVSESGGCAYPRLPTPSRTQLNTPKRICIATDDAEHVRTCTRFTHIT